MAGVHDGPVDDNEAAVLVTDPKESQILRAAHTRYWRTNLLEGELLHLSRCLRKGIEAEFLKEAELIGNLADELQGGHMVDMKSAAICAQEQLVVSSTNLREDHTFLRHRAHELSLLVQDQDLSTFTKDEEEICKLRNFHRGNVLLDVNPLLKLGIALGVFPELDALLLDS